MRALGIGARLYNGGVLGFLATVFANERDS